MQRTRNTRRRVLAPLNRSCLKTRGKWGPRTNALSRPKSPYGWGVKLLGPQLKQRSPRNVPSQFYYTLGRPVNWKVRVRYCLKVEEGESSRNIIETPSTAHQAQDMSGVIDESLLNYYLEELSLSRKHCEARRFSTS